MVFSSLEFVFRFLPVFLVIYYIVPGRWKNLWLFMGIRILYFPLGVLFFLWGIAQVVVMCCTIVLLPMAIPYAKSLSTFFNPVGKVCVPVAVMDELERRKAEKEVDAYLNK